MTPSRHDAGSNSHFFRAAHGYATLKLFVQILSLKACSSSQRLRLKGTFKVAPLAPITWSRTKMTRSRFGEVVRQPPGACLVSCASGASRTPADPLAIFNHFVS